GASSFSDWWAYKYEVIDAIPYNAAILDRMGVVTALNSDDAEMGRRLNQEAAKAVKYGGVSEEAAWKMVTLNPAKLLHIDDRTGSVDPGMDADLVLWSRHPLSSMARAERTLIDGVEYFNLETYEKLEKALKADKRRLAEKMSADKGPKKKVQPKEERHYHCDDIHDELK
ncbi:MAG TPA: amidohydrolase family protein, partial [Saprospiraceae bacterium]|nr:amidohydrolase family protein [Saprospiraceae bacterium]